VTTLVVDEALRGRGIGTQLLNEIAELARARGCKKMELDSGFHREQAHATYERYGLMKRRLYFPNNCEGSGRPGQAAKSVWPIINIELPISVYYNGGSVRICKSETAFKRLKIAS